MFVADTGINPNGFILPSSVGTNFNDSQNARTLIVFSVQDIITNESVAEGYLGTESSI